MPVRQCLLAFGANLGDPRQSWEEACRLLAERGFTILGRSSLHQTVAVSGTNLGQPDYLNAAILSRTSLEPRAVIGQLLAIEQQLGRARSGRWESRTVDLDLLLLDDLQLREPDLKVPHPRMAWRRFVLEPAAEVAGEMVHPVSRLTVRELLDRINQPTKTVVWLRDVRANADSQRGSNQDASSARLPDSGHQAPGPWRPDALALTLRQIEKAGVDVVCSVASWAEVAATDSGQRWRLVLRTLNEQAWRGLANVPLVVWDSRQGRKYDRWLQSSGQHRGAVLDLADSPDQSDIAAEILAAMRAMQPSVAEPDQLPHG